MGSVATDRWTPTAGVTVASALAAETTGAGASTGGAEAGAGVAGTAANREAVSGAGRLLLLPLRWVRNQAPTPPSAMSATSARTSPLFARGACERELASPLINVSARAASVSLARPGP